MLSPAHSSHLWGWTQMYSLSTWCPPFHALSLGFIFFTASVWSCCCFLAHGLFMRAGFCLVPSRCSINNFWISVVGRNLYGARATQQASKDNLFSKYGWLMILIWLLERERRQKSQCLHFSPVVQKDYNALNSRVSKSRNSKSLVPAVQPDSPNIFMSISVYFKQETLAHIFKVVCALVVGLLKCLKPKSPGSDWFSF